MGKQFKNDAITSRDVDFAQWYTDVCRKAELMDYASVKGFIIYKPYGYAIWENIQNYLNKRFKDTGHENVYFPMVIPETLFNKEKDHVEGFAPETLIATIGGKNKLEDRLIVRPTSEVLFCDYYAKNITSYRDLPKLYNQWCSVVRWEKTTRPFLRGSEFLWQEGHTMHANEKEARKETLAMLDIYGDLGANFLAIPFVKGRKTDKEKFAGAEETYSIEALMYDGKALQSGTTHYFGTGFCEAFGISFQDKDMIVKHPHQTSWGVSTRLIGAIIMVHGDDNGLILPPYVAPIQVVIIPIRNEEKLVQKTTKSIKTELEKQSLRVTIDDSDRSPGWKFSEYEMKGVPLRIEVGPRDLENDEVTIAIRATVVKEKVKVADVSIFIKAIIPVIHQTMLARAQRNIDDNMENAKTMADIGRRVNKGGYARVCWCGDESCESKVKEEFNATARCLPFNQELFNDTCPICGRKANKLVLFAKAY